jgi:hypothetical protein
LMDFSFLDYYFRYRDKINIFHMSQSILLTGGSKNISDCFKLLNSGIHNFSPSSKFVPVDMSILRRTRGSQIPVMRHANTVLNQDCNPQSTYVCTSQVSHISIFSPARGFVRQLSWPYIWSPLIGKSAAHCFLRCFAVIRNQP